MMKSSFLVCCLVLSVSAAPAPEPAPEPATKGGEKAAKLQFAPQDAQQSFYTQSIAAPDQQTVIRVAEAPRTIVKSISQSPLYIASSAGPRPYSSSRTTITTSGQNGQLPDGYVYEHHGETHIGHLAKAVHVKKQGSLTYAVAAPSSSIAGLQILSQAPNSAIQGGQIALINGRQAQQQANGQWAWLSQAAPAASSASWNSGWNSAWNSQSSPAYQTVSISAPQPQAVVYSQQPQQQTVTLVEQQQPQTVSIAAPQPQAVVYAQQQPQQPVVYAQQPQQQTVTLVEQQQPQVVSIAAPQPQAVVYAQEQPQTVTIAQAQPQAVVYAQQQPQSVVYTQQQPQTVTITESRREQPQAVVYSQQQPQTVTISRSRPALSIPAPAVQTLKTYTQEVSRPAVDSKWYTKTNRNVVSKFYAQAPQYVELASSKNPSAANPESSVDDEKDWKKA